MTYLIDFVNFIILMQFISKSYELEVFAKTDSFHVVMDRLSLRGSQVTQWHWYL